MRSAIETKATSEARIWYRKITTTYLNANIVFQLISVSLMCIFSFLNQMLCEGSDIVLLISQTIVRIQLNA